MGEVTFPMDYFLGSRSRGFAPEELPREEHLSQGEGGCQLFSPQSDITYNGSRGENRPDDPTRQQFLQSTRSIHRADPGIKIQPHRRQRKLICQSRNSLGQMFLLKAKTLSNNAIAPISSPKNEIVARCS